MKSKIYLLIALVASTFMSQISYGQIARDYFNKEVKDGQRITTKKVLRFLEKGLVDSVLQYVDSAYLAQNTDLKDKLTKASNQIQKVKNIATVSEGLIVFEENHNVFRCIYHDSSTDYQLVDIHYFEGDAHSKIAKFAFKDQKTLMKEKAERDKWNKNNVPPEPPVVR